MTTPPATPEKPSATHLLRLRKYAQSALAALVFALPVGACVYGLFDVAYLQGLFTPSWLLPLPGWMTLWLLTGLGWGISAAFLWPKRKNWPPSLPLLFCAGAVFYLLWNLSLFRLHLPALSFACAALWLLSAAVTMRTSRKLSFPAALSLIPGLLGALYLTCLSYVIALVNP